MSLRYIFCICLTLLYGYAESALVIKPQNVAAVSGEVVALHCASDVSRGNIAWSTINPGLTRRDIIYNDNVLAKIISSYISVSDKDDGNCSLYINASATAAKSYKCVDRDSGEEGSAELTVLERDPECDSTVLKDNSVIVNCSITSVGNWAPMVICKEYEENRERGLEGNKTKRFENNLVNDIWNFKGKNASFEICCWVKFEQSERPKGSSASNIPELNIRICVQRKNQPTLHCQTKESSLPNKEIIIIITLISTILVETSVAIICFTLYRKAIMRKYRTYE